MDRRPVTSPATDLRALTLHCGQCGMNYGLEDLVWRCQACGGVLDLGGFVPHLAGLAELQARRPTLWRYTDALPLEEPVGITMGEGMTPLVTVPGHPGLGLKMEYLMPTGSFKDRGAVMLVTLAERLSVPRLVADSSGNAGNAIAAYAARAGIPCDVYVPAATSSAKVDQLRALGAAVHVVDGTREDTADVAADAAQRPGVFYASHVYHPFFLQGTKTFVFELWEQHGGRLPACLLLPVGNGTLVLGAYLGCRELLAQGLIDQLPRLVAVQAESCAPLAQAMRDGLAVPPAVATSPTVAEGIAIARPARGAQILAAIRDSGGTIVTVTDAQVAAAHAALARSGLYVEPTAAVCWAAWQTGVIDVAVIDVPVKEGGIFPHTVAPLCGSGLKAGPPHAP